MPLLTNGLDSFGDMRRMGPQRSWDEMQQELEQQRRLHQALGVGQFAHPLGPGYMDPQAVAAGGKIPVLQKSGNISTEKTISFESDGKHYVIPTIVNGVSYTPDAAMKLWASGKNPHLGEFSSQGDAETFAEDRSRSLDKAFGGGGRLMKGDSDPAAGGLQGAQPSQPNVMEWLRKYLIDGARASP